MHGQNKKIIWNDFENKVEAERKARQKINEQLSQAVKEQEQTETVLRKETKELNRINKVHKTAKTK